MSIQVVTRKSGKRYRANVHVEGERILGKWQKTKKQAQLDETAIQHQVNTGTYIKETSKTLDECAKIYFEVTATQNLSQDTIDLEKGHYKNHLQPVFGHRKINSIRAQEVQELWSDKLKTHSSSTVNRLHMIMNKIFKQFIKWGEIKQNPMDNVDAPRVKYKEKETWSVNEIHRFLFHAKGYQSYMAFYLAIHTGMRMGEVLGLHWSDIDFDNKVIKLTEALNRKTRKRGPLKTEASRRFIYLDDTQIQVLKEYKESQKPESEIVCASSVGSYLSYSNVRRAMESIIKKADLKYISFHELRHTHTTLLAEAGVFPTAMANRLGHASTRTTLEVYTHVNNKANQETAKRFTTLLNEKS